MERRRTTAERGLGAAHIADRKRLLAELRPGEPCWRCGEPMFPHQQLDRDHVIDRVRGGTDGPAVLAHRHCNRSAGARLGNQIRPPKGSRRWQPAPPCKTCGKPADGRAARNCEICGAHYHPSHGEQRSCSRACGVELRRRKYGGKQSSQPRRRTCDCPPGKHKCFTRISYRNCATCRRVFIVRGRTLTCSAECHAAYQAAAQSIYRDANPDRQRERARRANDRLGEARGWPRGRGVYNVGKEPWNKSSRDW